MMSQRRQKKKQWRKRGVSDGRGGWGVSIVKVQSNMDAGAAESTGDEAVSFW